MCVAELIKKHPSLDPAFFKLDEVQLSIDDYRQDEDSASTRFVEGIFLAKLYKLSSQSVEDAENKIAEITNPKLAQRARGVLHCFIMSSTVEESIC